MDQYPMDSADMPVSRQVQKPPMHGGLLGADRTHVAQRMFCVYAQHQCCFPIHHTSRVSTQSRKFSTQLIKEGEEILVYMEDVREPCEAPPPKKLRTDEVARVKGRGKGKGSKAK